MSAPPGSIDLGDLDISQLQAIKQQLEEETSHLTNSFAQLRQAHGRFRDCLESVKVVKKANEGKTLLVPLTASLYVPGKFAETDKVIIDIGTGYFVEKSIADAQKFYQGKIDFVSANLTKLQDTITGKQNNLRVLVNVMQSKISEGAQSSKA